MTAADPAGPRRLRLSLAQLRYVAELAGTALPAELTALADAAAHYDGTGADSDVEDLVSRGVVTRDASGAVAATDRLRASLRLLGTPEVAVDVRGRVGHRSTLASCAIGGTACVSVSVSADGAVELTSLPASELAAELPRLVPPLPAGPAEARLADQGVARAGVSGHPAAASHGMLRAQVRRGAPDGSRLGQVTWVADGTGWRALVPGQDEDGRPGVRLTPRVPSDLATDLAPWFRPTSGNCGTSGSPATP